MATLKKFKYIKNWTGVPSLVTALPDFVLYYFKWYRRSKISNGVTKFSRFFHFTEILVTPLLIQYRKLIFLILDQNLVPRTLIKGISLYFNELTQNEGNPFIFEVNLGYPLIFYLVFFFSKNLQYYQKNIDTHRFFFILIFSKKYEIAEIFW